MMTSDFTRFALSGCAAVLLASCSGSQPPIGGSGAAMQSRAIATHAAQRAVFGMPAPDSATRGIYASEYNMGSLDILGYAKNNRKNGPPTCSLSTSGSYGDIAVDAKGDLIVPEGFNTVAIFKGPGMCGPKLGSIQLFAGGDAVDAASADAADGKIAVAAYQDGSAPGSIEVCTLKSGCTNLQNPDMNFVSAVALAKNGDCWGSSQQAGSMGGAVLTYFGGCSGSGQTATGYKNSGAGGLDIDKDGNIVSIDSSSTPEVYVYSGCKPTCKILGGPFALKGGALYGHLNEDSTRYAAADGEYNQVDVYAYSSTMLTYMYSFNNGLPSDYLVGLAYNARSKE